MTLRKGLTRLEGVADAKLIVKPAHMQVRMKAGYWPDLPRMLQTIRDAGYQPVEDRIDLRVTGKVVKQGDQVALELDGMKSPVMLPVVPAKEDADTAPHLAEKHLGQTVEVEGHWLPAADGKGPGTLAATRIGGAETKGHS